MNAKSGRQRFVLIPKLISLLSVPLLFFTVLTPVTPVRAQTATCDCFFVSPCDPLSGELTPSVAGPGGTYTVCAGKRIDPTLRDIVQTNPAQQCGYMVGCTDTEGCAPCSLTYEQAHAIISGSTIEGSLVASQNRTMCETGAYCGGVSKSIRCAGTPVSDTVCNGVWTSGGGLFSSLFKQCFCGYMELIQVLVDIGYSIIATLSVVMFAIGGWKYIFSRNDPEKIADAKATLTGAVLGFIFVVLSIALLNLLQAQFAPWGIRFLEYYV